MGADSDANCGQVRSSTCARLSVHASGIRSACSVSSRCSSRVHLGGRRTRGAVAVTPRTLRRDIERCGVSAIQSRHERRRRRVCARAGCFLPPLSLDEDEATAVFVGLHAAAGSGVTGAGTASLRALAKSRRVLPARLRQNLRALQSSVLELAVKSRPFSLASVSLLARACSERLVTRIVYAGRDGAETDRRVEPLRLVRIGALWYLLDGIPRRRTGGPSASTAWRRWSGSERFASRPPPDGDLVAYVTRSLVVSASPPREGAPTRAD